MDIGYRLGIEIKMKIKLKRIISLRYCSLDIFSLYNFCEKLIIVNGERKHILTLTLVLRETIDSALVFKICEHKVCRSQIKTAIWFGVTNLETYTHKIKYFAIISNIAIFLLRQQLFIHNSSNFAVFQQQTYC